MVYDVDDNDAITLNVNPRYRKCGRDALIEGVRWPLCSVARNAREIEKSD
jgi:hypothetical protein